MHFLGEGDFAFFICRDVRLLFKLNCIIVIANEQMLYFTTAFRTALGSTQPPIQLITGTLSLRVKRPGREADHSPPSSAEVKE
jgi:hypothetical protein